MSQPSPPLDGEAKRRLAIIREWRAVLLGNGVGRSEVAKAYRFLRAVLMMAAHDQIIPRNPCRIRGAGEEKPEERPVLTVAKVFELAELAPVRLRALILLATFASLRWGEVAALRRMDLNVAARTVSVRQQHVELDTGELLVGPPSPTRESVRSPSRKRSSRHFAIISTSSPAQKPTRWSSQAHEAASFAAATSGARPSGTRTPGRSGLPQPTDCPGWARSPIIPEPTPPPEA